MKRFILLVEDDKELVSALTLFLEKYKYHVISAATVKEAVAKMRIQAFFCVITDIRLSSGGSGEDLVEQIRNGPERDPNLKVPILVISGFLDRPLAERLINQVNGALVKPFSQESLLKKLKSFHPNED